MSTKKTTTMAPPKSRLTCELCQRRKVKCDKGNPCSTCQRAGVKCEAIDRQRLPRGRNGGRRKGDTDLKARVARLESLLVSNLGGTLKLDDSLQSSNDETVKNESIRTHQGDMSRYLGSSFWSSLSSEVSSSTNSILSTLTHASCSKMGELIKSLSIGKRSTRCPRQLIRQRVGNPRVCSNTRNAQQHESKRLQLCAMWSRLIHDGS